MTGGLRNFNAGKSDATSTENDPASTGNGSASTAELVQRLTEQFTRLVRAEIHLAQLEMKQKATRTGIGVGLVFAALLTVLYAIGALVAALTLGLATVMPGWVAALLVGFFLLAVAVALVAAGRVQFKNATPPTPQKTIDRVKADIAYVKQRLSDRP